MEKISKEDLIRRSDAIDAVHKDYNTILDFKSDGRTVAGSFEDIINTLPSAQPEIIRCKNCRWWERESICEGHCLEMDLHHFDEDHYCGFAERRTDE